ncbi:MAG: VCBS repeat-containing protein [Rhodocyclaceae bacterium]|nr:VCBS repeat-containing protein [Rhodocyclaceae bacterium]
MRVTSSQVDMAVRHQQHSARSVREHLRAWVGERPARDGAASDAGSSGAPPRIASQRQADGRGQVARDNDRCGAVEADFTGIATSLLKALAEMLTGRRIEVFDASELDSDAPQPSATEATPSQASGRGSAGFGIVYERVERVEREESLRFAASGEVLTADGRSIRFEVGLSLDSHVVHESRTEVRMGDAIMEDPLVLNFDGRGASLLAERMHFDIDADGSAESVARLAAGSGYLVLDRNGNGQVDDGSELFGPATGNGFAELARLDDDGNGWIDEADAAFARLQVWRPGEALQGLAGSGVGAIRTDAAATPFTLSAGAGDTLGALRASSVYLDEAGGVGLVQQVDLAV